MKKLNIKIVKLTVLFSLLTFTSCDDFLDRYPEGEVANLDELGVSGYESAIFGVYSLTRTTAVGGWQRYWFGSIRSDDAAKGSTDGDSAANGTAFNNFDYVTTNGLSTSWWNAHYEIIFTSNEIINNIEALENPSEDELVLLAEARTFRAWMYFELRRDYGEVPIITATIDVPEDAFAPKSTIQEIDDFIQTDLEFAIEYLPQSWDQQFTGRITVGFANSLLAKLFLYQENWELALEKCNEVIGSGMYSLDPDLVNLFELGGDNGVESIFEIQQLVTDAQNYNSNYFVSQGVRGTNAWNLGWGFNVPTQELVDVFEVDDLRKENTILVSGEEDGGFGGGMLPESPPLAQPYWNKKAYTNASLRSQFSMNANRWENIKIIRYADVILMAAEAANELGKTAEATTWVNQIRSRAGLNNVNGLGQSDLRDAIKQERRVEFAMEESRFYDLVRWGDAVSVLGSLGYQPKNEFFPIPQEAIDNSGGVIIQNPNY